MSALTPRVSSFCSWTLAWTCDVIASMFRSLLLLLAFALSACGGGAETSSPEATGRRAFAALQADDFEAFEADLVATPDEVRAACPGITGVDLNGVDRMRQETHFDRCRSDVDFSEATLREVAVKDETYKIQGLCDAGVKQADVFLSLEVRGQALVVQLDDVRSLPSGWKQTDVIRACGVFMPD